MKITKMKTFDSNKQWLKAVLTLDGKRAYSDEQIENMTEEQATDIAKDIMTE